MGIKTKLNNFLFDGVREAAANEIHTKALAEAFTMLDLAIEDAGWNNLTQNARISDVKRTADSVHAQTQKNFREYNSDGRVKRGANLHTDFTFGNGIQKPKAKNPIIQKIVDRIWNDPTNQRNMFSFVSQQKRHRETYLGGELNLRFKVDPNRAHFKIYVLQSKNVRGIASDEDDPERSSFYAIRHRKERLNLTTGATTFDKEELKIHRQYRYKLENATEEEFERGLIYHAGLNELFGQKRGDSDVSTVRPASKTANDMAEDGATLSKANAEMGFKTNLKKGGKAMKDKLVDMLKTKTDGSNPSPSVGAEWVQNESLDRNWNTARDTGSQYRQKDQRMVLLSVFAGLGFGEHYYGDASTGNLATSTAMELPVIKMTESEQKFWESIYLDIFNFAIDLAVAFGLIDGRVLDWDEFYIETAVDSTLDIDFPPIVKQDAASFVSALAIAVDKQLISDKEAARLAAATVGVENIEEMIEDLFGLSTESTDIPQVPPVVPAAESQGGKYKDLKLV